MLLLVLSFCLVTVAYAQQPSSLAQQGTIHISHQALMEKGAVVLDGEWEFYWQELRSPSTPSDESPTYFALPAIWNEFDWEGQPLEGQGYATFRLHIALEQDYDLLALEVPAYYNSYVLWVNDSLVSKNGTVGTSAEGSEPKWIPLTQAFLPPSRNFDITIQVSNYRHVRGGLYKSPTLGTHEYLNRKREIDVGIDLLLTGSITIIGLFFLGLFLFWRKDKSILYFALFCIFMSYRAIGTNMYFIVYLFPDLPWSVSVKLEYLSLYLGVVACFMFIHALFPKDTHRYILMVLQAISGLFALMTLFLPPTIYTLLPIYYQIILMVYFAYAFGVFTLAYRRKEEGAVFAIISILILIGTSFFTVLGNLNVIAEIPYLNSFGFIAFIFSQSFILSFRFSKAFHQVERLRTETNEQKNAIEARNRELEQLTEEIASQRDHITAQHQVAEEKNQLITSSIRYAQTIQQTILPFEKQMSHIFKEHFVMFYPKDIVSGDFYWCYEQGDTIYFAVVDCTGHGVPGAFMTMVGNMSLLELIAKKGLDNPAEILRQLHEGIYQTLRQDQGMNDDGMDICLCKCQKQADGSAELVFAGAYRPLFYTDKGELKELSGDNLTIGGTHRKNKPRNFRNHQLSIPQGESIYLTTDGLFDQNNAKRKKYGKLRFKAIIEENTQLPLQEQYDRLNQSLMKHKGEEAQRDDITVVGIRFS